MQNDAAQDTLREEALLRLKKKREFTAHAMAYVTVNGFLVVIWATVTGGFLASSERRSMVNWSPCAVARRVSSSRRTLAGRWSASPGDGADPPVNVIPSLRAIRDSEGEAISVLHQRLGFEPRLLRLFLRSMARGEDSEHFETPS